MFQITELFTVEWKNARKSDFCKAFDGVSSELPPYWYHLNKIIFQTDFDLRDSN